MDTLMISPPKMYEVNGQVCKVRAVTFVLGVGSNLSVLAAIPGKIARIMAWRIQSASTTVGNITFKNGSGGVVLIGPETAPANTSPMNTAIPWDAGYEETSVNTAIVADVVTAAVYGTLFYIAYTP